MLKNFNDRFNKAVEAYSHGPRKSWMVGGVVFPVLVISWVTVTNLNIAVLSEIFLVSIILTLFFVCGAVALETKKWRKVPFSIFIFMGFGISIVGALASVTENTPEQVLNSYLLFMTIFGIFGVFAASMGAWSYTSLDSDSPS